MPPLRATQWSSGITDLVRVGCDRMATRLEDRLLSGERVVFRAHHGLVSTAVFIVIFSAVLSAAYLAVGLVFSACSAWQSWIIYVLVFAGYFLWRIWNRTVLVTDQRVIYAHGEWKKKFSEVPLQMIERVVFTPGIGTWGGFVSIRCHDDEEITLGLLPKLEDLRDAIASQCGLPVPPRTDAKILTAIGLLNVSGCIGVLLAVAWSMRLGFDFVEGGLPQLSDAAFYALLISAPLVMFSSGIVGGVLGHLLGLVCLRIILAPDGLPGGNRAL